MMKTSRHTLQQGWTIVELMVAMVIALILILGATGVLITNQRAFRTTEGISGIQDSSRVAVDMLARDLREAGGRPCVMSLSSDYDYTLDDPLAAGFIVQLRQHGGLDYAPSGAPSNKAAAQDALEMINVTNNLIITQQTGGIGSTSLAVNNTESLLAPGDLIIACTSKAAYLLKVTAANTTSISVAGVPPTVSLTGATIGSGLTSRLWYIGSNADGRPNSLWRRIDNNLPVEMVDNVVGLTATPIGQGAVRIQLTVCSRLTEQDGLPSATPGSNLEAAQTLCDAAQNRVARTVTTIVHRRAA